MPVREEGLLEILQLVAPGTALRDALDRIIKGGKGAIVVIGYDDHVEALRSGGFRMSSTFTAQRLSEVAKMDGAIILDEDVTQILYANVHLVPDPTVPTSETGTRHRTAERVARQTGRPVISVSESMQFVSLYVDDAKHVLEDLSSILFRANHQLATLERYRTRLDEVAATLSTLELEHAVTLRDVLRVVERAELVRRIADEIEWSIAQLGTDGRLLQLQLDELLLGAEVERLLVVRDYVPDAADLVKVLDQLDRFEAEDLLDHVALAKALGFPLVGGEERPVAPRGFRALARIPRLPEPVVTKLAARFGSLRGLMDATTAELDAVEGIGEARARHIRDGLARLAEAARADRYAAGTRRA